MMLDCLFAILLLLGNPGSSSRKATNSDKFREVPGRNRQGANTLLLDRIAVEW